MRYIDADALLDKRWDVPFETKNAHYVQVVDVADIEDAPTADVAEVKHGKWLSKYVGMGHYWECSECVFMLTTMGKTNYCPCCGAKMKGDEQ